MLLMEVFRAHQGAAKAGLTHDAPPDLQLTEDMLRN